MIVVAEPLIARATYHDHEMEAGPRSSGPVKGPRAVTFKIKIYRLGFAQLPPGKSGAGSGYRPLLARVTAAAMACASGSVSAPATSTVGVPPTPAAVARAVTYAGQAR